MSDSSFVAVLGALCGLGLFAIAAGVQGRAIVRRPDRAPGAPTTGRKIDRLLLRICCAVAGGVVAAVLTGWPVGCALVALAGWTAPSALAARGRHADDVAKVEGIATWSEQVRDTLAAANGLEHAMSASATLAPIAIRPAVARMSARLEYEPLSDVLRQFADDLDHPLGDFVCAALITAAEKQARDVAQLLGYLAECARNEAMMRTRVWVGRARTRTALRVMTGTIVVVVSGLILFRRDYLAPFDTSTGQLALALIGMIFAGSVVSMERMGRIALPDRFVGRRDAAGVTTGAVS